MTQRIVIEHLARVEGHGGVTVELEDEGIGAVHFDIFEGARLLETLVRGRRFDEVAPIASRICAICSAAHTIASLTATEHAFGMLPSAQTTQLRNLLLRGENIESHALHIFLLALPDYLGAPSAIALAADRRDVVALALRLKRLGNALQEAVGGRAIHPVTAVVGGFTHAPSTDDLLRLRAALEEGAADVRSALDVVASLPTIEVGHSPTAYAALHTPDGYDYAGGTEIRIETNGKVATVPVPKYRSLTDERVVAHSHAKHTLWKGAPVMVGALGRVAVNGAHLPRTGVHAAMRLELTAPFDDPLDNNLAQAVELAVDVERALEVVDLLLADARPAEPVAPVTPRAGTGTGAVEAPRGLLVHSYRYDGEGRLETADVVTPTALNAASVEHRLRAAVEQSPSREPDDLRPTLEMVVRAYDPCISCAVHVLDRRRAP